MNHLLMHVRRSDRIDSLIAMASALLFCGSLLSCSNSKNDAPTQSDSGASQQSSVFAQTSNVESAPETNSEALSPEQLNLLSNDPVLKKWLAAPAADELLKGFSKKARETLDIGAARVWAHNFARQNAQSPRLVPMDLPESVRALEPTAPPFVRLEKASDGSSAVFVFWGGGWQRWGIVFTTNKSLLQRVRILTEQVDEGAYAFVSADNP